MLEAAKEEIFSVPMVWTGEGVLPLAADPASLEDHSTNERTSAATHFCTTTQLRKNSRLGFSRKNAAPHQGSAWSNSARALGIREALLENRGGSRYTGKERDSESGLDNFGARYDSSQYGRFMSPDSGVDQRPENPQSWNLYSYVQNNPVNIVDPSGEFTCDSKTVSDQQCENAHASDDKAGAALAATKDKDSKQYKDALRAHEALGGRNDNGVVLSVGNPGKDADGTVAIGPMQGKTDENPNGQNIKVIMSADNFNGDDNGALGIEHEGSHVADAHDWINTGFRPSASVNWYQSEFRAYSVEGYLARAMGDQESFHDGREVMGAGTPENAQGSTINSILSQSPYHLNPNSKLMLWQDHTKGGH